MAGGCNRKRTGTFEGLAFVANQDGKAVAVVQLDPFALVRHIPLDSGPTALALHPSKPLVYALTPETGVLHEIDAREMRRIRGVQLGRHAVGMRMSVDGHALWVLSSGGTRLVRVPLDTFKQDAAITLAAPAVDLDVAPYFGLGCASLGTRGVQLVALDTAKAGVVVSPGGEIGFVRFRSDGKAVLAADRANRQLIVLRAPDGQAVTRLPLAVRPDNVCFHPDGGQMFISGDGMDAVVVVFPHFVPYVAETILAGRAPGPLTATEQFLFVTSPSAGDVAVFDIVSKRLIAVAAVGAEPGFVAITPKDEYALVLNRQSGDMAVIRIGAITPNRRKTVSLLTMVPVGSKPVTAVIMPA
jgi:DNA-binding beta-propeller fold protein YncE